MALVDFFDDGDLEDIQARHQRLNDLGCPTPDQKKRKENYATILKDAGKPTKQSNLIVTGGKGRTAPAKVVRRW